MDTNSLYQPIHHTILEFGYNNKNTQFDHVLLGMLSLHACNTLLSLLCLPIFILEVEGLEISSLVKSSYTFQDETIPASRQMHKDLCGWVRYAEDMYIYTQVYALHMQFILI